MAKIIWQEVQNDDNISFPPLPTIDELQAEIEQLREEKKMTDLALLELVEMILGGDEGGE